MCGAFLSKKHVTSEVSNSSIHRKREKTDTQTEDKTQIYLRYYINFKTIFTLPCLLKKSIYLPSLDNFETIRIR